MRTESTFFRLLLVFVYFFGIVTMQSMAQTVNVTIRLNTATNLDTIRADDFVQIRGQVTGTIIPSITWDQNSGIIMNNIGGDYWETTVQMTTGSSINYKFWTGQNATTPTFFNTGWEGNLTSPGGGGNRYFVAGASDTTLLLQYYNGITTERQQYWRPFQSKPDSIAIYFRVNMGGVIFDPATQLVDVRGGLPLGTTTWAPKILTLTRESSSVNAGSFQSGVVYIAKDSITPGTLQEFKFVIQPENWENVGNRSFIFSSKNDTTISWYYFNDRAPSGPAVTADVLFRLKLNALEGAGLFNRALGDKVAVTGAKGWPPATFDFDTEPTMLKMTYNSDLEEWNLLETFTKFPNEVIEYKYYIHWDTSRVDTASANYIPGLDLTNGWEEPGVTGGGNRTYVYTDELTQLPEGDFGYDQQFFNSIPPEGLITNPINLTFKINMTPATDVNSNPTNPLFRPGIDTAYIQFDGSFVPVTQGLPMYGETNRILLEDTDGDLVYTNTWSLNPPTFYQLCYHVVYTSPSGDIENGGGVQRGRRYYQYIQPTSINPVVWPTTYELNELVWMNDSLTVEDPPQLIVGVDDDEQIPINFTVSQNYPNPFNPSTSIKYSIPNHSLVQIRVYDITGSLVKTLYNAEQNAGKYEVLWNSKDNEGNQVATGIYFMQFRAGDYSNTIKMMLLK
ncbi:MAG: T9SS type A sorting domain-containing protein [Ignavibacteriales bacterium]|nr:T9SS type A sorting domain-containing protein [Ignavibacteriales bacterium]